VNGAILFRGRDVIELHEVGIATTPRPLAESQDGFPVHQLTLLPGGRLKQSLPGYQVLAVQITFSFRLRPMLMIALTMVVSSGVRDIWRTNDWSILRASTGSFWR
jgi:hypothetical protein